MKAQVRTVIFSWLLAAFLVTGGFVLACAVAPAPPSEKEAAQLEERVAQLETQVAELRETVRQIKLSHDEFGVILDGITKKIDTLSKDQQDFITGLGETFRTLGVGGGFSPVITESLKAINERNNYFYGKLMTVRDFETEQQYLRDKMSEIETRLDKIEQKLGIVPPPPSAQ